jgi:hypothetical protein
MYYRNAQAAVVVYDVTKASSLEKAKSWVKELQRQANPNIVIALAGNKIDLVQPPPSSPGAVSSESEDEADDATATPGEASGSGEEPESLRQVPSEEAQAYATEAGLLFFETSAKTGEGIVDIFTEIGTYFLTCQGVSYAYLFAQPKRSPLNTFWHLHAAVTVAQALQVVVRAHQKGVLTLKKMLLNRKMPVIARSYVFRDAFMVSPLMTFLFSTSGFLHSISYFVITM